MKETATGAAAVPREPGAKAETQVAADGAAGDATSPPDASQAPPRGGTTAGGVLRAAAVTAAVWWAALGLLAIGTANPVTLNRAQILSATAVVTGHVVDAEAGTVRVERQFHGIALPEEITVEGLADSGARNGRTYVLPLSGFSPEELQVEPSRLPGQPRLIYPATEAALAQLAGIHRVPAPPEFPLPAGAGEEAADAAENSTTAEGAATGDAAGAAEGAESRGSGPALPRLPGPALPDNPGQP